MKNGLVVLILVIAVALAFYLLGKKNGAGQTKTDIIQNVEIVKQIAQLSSLEVNGTTKITVTNKGDNAGFWNKVKNYFAENTLQVTVPYEAKYGVDMSNQKIEIDKKAQTVTLQLPPVKLLSMQLRLDKMDNMQQTGLFSTITVDAFVKAQKDMYAAANATLVNNAAYIKLAQENINNTLNRYYAPLGYKVNIVFGEIDNKNNLK
ncbi:MAG TPA: DUF4230 domain-containing protein [Ferruginibacter sp.]|nr:DUF4230 domain-containing protein [Ferruginibacter sp.]HRE64156.1 DUF4230 domain-containing protein [Ferruginibacter sp.]